MIKHSTMPLAALPLLRRLPRPRPRPYVCQQCTRNRRSFQEKSIPLDSELAKWTHYKPDEKVPWGERARHIRAGMEESMVHVLEQRGLVKDVAGGREALDWLLTEKPIGVYVGVDPTAPSLHVGHLLPLMALYWMYIYGYHTVTLLGAGTVQIGDPSGRTTARQRSAESTQRMNIQCIGNQLEVLWKHVNALGVRHGYSPEISRRREVLNNRDWLQKLSAVDLMRDLGSGMRLGSMLARDSVKTRMEGSEGMSVAEFSYPLFQAYDWWHMYCNQHVQLQIGGSDQYGNICAGMDAVDHMRKLRRGGAPPGEDDTLNTTFGLTTPLLTTASGEKFGKSAGNAVWLDQDMMSSFDLYQYFLRTSDDEVERYLRLFTFLPISEIALVMTRHGEDGSKRIAQHVLAKELVSLAHGASWAVDAEAKHKGAFSEGTSRFSQLVIRKALKNIANQERSKVEEELLAHKKSYSASVSPTQQPSSSLTAFPGSETVPGAVKLLPLSILQSGTFPRVFCAAGLASTISEARRLIQSQGAYVICPNSGTEENLTSLKWEPVWIGADPKDYLVDFDALVLRSGKTKIQICQVVVEEKFEAAGLNAPWWEAFKAKRDLEAEAVAKGWVGKQPHLSSRK
ncbi:tyrosyl-tRNA synthetase-like protein [Amniculicola lignicola CBS 123094]|uniref:Tyrosine--tRNA ligase n=1 Tax=Amniculicola lignicola CBS 123094 TaxID=1392246 RepID=A0A6A5X148_9PLEO|nr:tyrosyl-tRNA synthetase-like protein [Amniculicola lignicola CBS 123094]